MKQKLAQGLPVNVVVMMIIGIILFGIGMGIFSNISKSGEDTIDDLNGQIKDQIANLECNGDQWICTPKYEMKSGTTKTFQIFVANKDDLTQKYNVELNLVPVEDREGISNDCGEIKVSYANAQITVQSGYSASFPINVKASRVKKTPCSFVTIAKLYDEDQNEIDKTTAIFRVE